MSFSLLVLEKLETRLGDLETLVKYHEKRFQTISEKVEMCNKKLDFVSTWVMKKMGVKESDFYNQDSTVFKLPDALESVSVIPKKTTFQMRSRQIMTSMKKRRCSSLSQESTVIRFHRYIRDNRDKMIKHHNHRIDITKDFHPDTHIPANAVATILNRGKPFVSEHVIDSSPNSPINLSCRAALSINEDAKSADDLPTLDKNSRRGRPKKNPGEKATPKSRTPMVCDQCGKVLKGPSSLRSHKLSHSNERPFKCDFADCGKAFRMKHHLDFHILTHDQSGKKKWPCQFCEKGFIAQRDLLRHERTHTGERPFKCSFEQCSKSFNVKQHLILHIRTHTKERPYKCTICEKNFTQANSLRIHKKIHVKEKPSSPSSSNKPTE